jgi:hypothetical protein
MLIELALGLNVSSLTARSDRYLPIFYAKDGVGVL